MQRKLMVLLTTLVLFSSLLAPAGTAQAQDTPARCPRYEPAFLQDKEVRDLLPQECVRTYKEAAREAQEAMPAPEADLQTLAVGGPDDFGYTWDDTVTYSWISATTDSGLIGDDDFTGPIDIGFTFPFYGLPQTELYIGTNGYITFGAGSSAWDPFSIPNELAPDNFIAPFFNDLFVGEYGNTGAVYYSQGGSAPNRYIVVEWRDVESYDGDGLVTFEAILYENGNILIQHKSLPPGYFSTVGIENSASSMGLQYQHGSQGLSVLNAIRFTYPTTPTARVQTEFEEVGGFIPLNGERDFQFTVTNSGTLGTDTYDLFFGNIWAVTLYASDGVTPLTDTDGDGEIDTGPLAQGATRTMIVRVSAPLDGEVGDTNVLMVGASSSLDATKSAWLPVYLAIPAGFAQVYQDNADGAMSLRTTDLQGSQTHKATTDHYFGYGTAMERLPNGNYFYAWHKMRETANALVREIEYTLLDPDGNTIVPPTKLTNHSAAVLQTIDTEPTVAVAPNGTIGVIWNRSLYNYDTDQDNHNVYFAILNSAGNVTAGPINVTNNMAWGGFEIFDTPVYFDTTVAATSDNRFVVSWTDSREIDYGSYIDNILYAVYNTAGTSVVPLTALTTDDASWSPVLSTLNNGRVIFTWSNYGYVRYAVLNSSGAVIKQPTDIPYAEDWSHDAVQLPNGKVAVVNTIDSGVQLTILNTAYNIETSNATMAPYFTPGSGISATTDASSRVIMTWVDAYNYNKLTYALGDSTGAFINDAIFYYRSSDYIDLNSNGNGTAPYKSGDPVEVTVGSTLMNSYPLLASESTRVSYSGVNAGPVKLDSKHGIPVIAAERLIYKVNNVPTSYSEMMGLPDSQLDTTYWLPWYNNKDFNTQLRFANVSNAPASVHVYIGDVEMPGSPFDIAVGASARKSFPNVNNGPVKIVSNVNIVAAERLIYTVNNVDTSYSELMALPNSQLDTTYWLPWYNNKDFDTQLRFANVSNTPASVRVYIGGVEMPGSPFNIPVGASTRQSFIGVNNGPVRIESNVNIVAAERLIYKVNGVNTSYSELMALPNKQLEKSYWLPWYNNKDFDTQLRFANVSNALASVHVYIGGVEMPGSPFSLAAGASTRQSFIGVNNGPVQIVSNVNIVAAERLIYKVNGVNTSYSELMALPNSQLDITYWLPWYNNVDFDTQLRFGLP